MVVTYKLLGQPVNPVNRKDIFLEINHDQQAIIEKNVPSVGIRNLYFANEDILRVMSYLNNAPGITEGAPFQIEIKEQGQTEVLNMYLKLMENFFRSKDGISCTVKMVDSVDHLDDQVNGFTFETMYNETGVTPFIVDNISYPSYQKYLDDRCIFIPYVISTIPDKHNAFMALVGVVFVAIQIYRGIKDIIEAAEVVIQLIIELPFIVALVFTLITLIEQMINFLIQPLKYHGAMLMIDMLKLVAVKTGRKFISSQWNTYPLNSIAYIPAKYQPPKSAQNQWSIMPGFNLGGFGSESAKQARVHGYTSPGLAPATPHDSATPGIQHGYYEGIAGDFMRLAKKFINGKIILPNGTTDLVMERRDYSPNAPTYQLPDIRQDWNGYNTEELFANMVLQFTKDLNDKNCIDEYEGTIYQITHQQVNTVNKHLAFLEGVRQIQIDAARGIRKVVMTDTENMMADIITIMNNWRPLIIAFLNSTISGVNSTIIFVINPFIFSMNGFILAVTAFVNTFNAVINFINSLGAGLSNATLTAPSLIPFFQLVPFITNATFPPLPLLDARIGAMLVENDFISVPKMVLIDTGRSEWNQRIGFLRHNNKDIVNAKYLWDNYYYIDAFVGTPNNRRTKIAPALNSDSETNPVLISLAKVKELISNPNFNDNFAEPVELSTAQWYPEKNGSTNIHFRKAGWLRDPQNKDGAKRAQEIHINLQLKKSLPNGN